MKEYNEQVVETLDDAGCIIANKNIIIDNLQARIAELEAENARLNGVIKSNIDDGIDKIMAMSDEQVSALAGFEGSNPEDKATIARQCMDIAMLRVELATLKTELREICAAIDDPACDLTLTTVECIKKLKAENESLKRDAERLDFILRKQLIVIQDYDDKYFTYNAQSGKRGPEMDSEAEAIDAAMAQGEK